MPPRFHPAWLALSATLLLVSVPLAAKAPVKAPAPPPAKAKAAAPAPPADAAHPPRKVIRLVNGVPDTATYLPDTTVIAIVGDRVERIGDFKRGWFNAWVPDLPASDSAGRAQFLSSMVSRDLLALEAHRLQVPLGFEDRLALREHRQRVLGGLLFRRAVLESVSVSNEEVDHAYDNYRYDILARHILFDDELTAAKVRADLVAKRIGWEDAVRRYTRDDATRATGGSLGWQRYGAASPVVAMEIWPLSPDVISPVFLDDDGYHVAQVQQRRPGTLPDFNAARGITHGYFERYRIARRLEALQAQMRTRLGLSYDFDNLAFASRYFTNSVEMKRGEQGNELTLNEALPEFEPADTARVLARYHGGTYTLGRFLTEFSHISVAARPSVNTAGQMRKAVDGFLLEPAMADEAVARGLENDPVTVRGIATKTEELMVGHLYEDSVGTHTWLSPQERRKFYQQHLAAYITFPKVVYAAFAFKTKARADTAAAALRSGIDAQQVLADSVRYHMASGSIQTRRQGQHGAYHKLLFEELRPGKVTVEGPAKDGSYFTIQLLSYDPGRQLSYEEAAAYVEEDAQKLRGEELLAQFVERLKQRYPVMSRPELVMGIRLVED